MNETIFRFYGLFHRLAKYISGYRYSKGNIYFNNDLSLGIKAAETFSWQDFISNSEIPAHDPNSGLHYAGYVAETHSWCHASWIWTNAAIIRTYCSIGKIAEAEALGKLLAERQTCEGGWIVRNDYDKNGAIPVMAPSDSAYIANNAFLTLYESIGKPEYLHIAEQCAGWVMKTTRPDGMVYGGYNLRDHKWDMNHVIVDVGFTAGLFARLYELTGKTTYKTYLERFVRRYIELFFIHERSGFCTSIDMNNRQTGGMFGRGQAWALEGLIPAYRILQDNAIKCIIDRTISNLLDRQCKDGSWSYNLVRPMMGRDCKSVPVIAKNLMEWYLLYPSDGIKAAVNRAYLWCLRHTCNKGEAKGGIFSYSVEGAIVQSLYTSCAFVYSSAYAIELQKKLASLESVI